MSITDPYTYLGDEAVRLRFWSKVLRPSPEECWLWTAAVDSSGYGCFRINGRAVGAHRISYMMTYGPLSPEKCVLHHCDTRRCVNPAHLSADSVAANNHDARAKGRAVPPPHPRGERHPRARLTAAEVEFIRTSYAPGAPARILAQMYGVSVGHVRNIALGRRWKEAV